MELNNTERKQQEYKQDLSDDEPTRTASPPPPNDTTSDFVEINNLSAISQSENRIQGLLDSSNPNDSSGDEKQQNDENDVPVQNGDHNTNSITASTLVITKSQIIDELNKSCVDLGDDLNDSKASEENKNKENGLKSAEESTSSSEEEEKDEKINNIVDEQVNLNDSNDEARNSIEVIQENKEEIQQNQENEEKDLQKSVVNLEHSNQTFEEYGPLIREKENVETEKTDESGMNKSYVESGYQYVDSNNKQEENQNEEHEIQKKQTKLQNSSLDDDNLEKDYEIPKIEQFVKLDKADIDARINEFKQDISDNESSPSKKLVKPVKVRNLDQEEYVKILGGDSLQKKIIQYGEDDSEGRVVRPRNGQMVTISYKAFIHETNELVEDHDNLSFILGDGDVMSAIDLVVCLMDKNEICEVIAEARHAYGKIGKKLPPKTTVSNTLFIEIPPNTTLFYRMHLKEFTDVTEMMSMQPIERLSLAEAKKLRGNFYFNRQEFYLADASYKKGLAYFNEENLTGDEEPVDLEKFLELRQALLMNLSLSTFKQGEYRLALNSLDQLLMVHKSHVKALFVKAKCLINLGETKEAIEYLTKCHELDKTNQDVKTELTKAQAKYKLQYENEKKMYQKMIGGVSPDSKNEKKATNSKTNNESSNFLTYVVAGVAVAAVSIGVTMLAKYKNMI